MDLSRTHQIGFCKRESFYEEMNNEKCGPLNLWYWFEQQSKRPPCAQCVSGLFHCVRTGTHCLWNRYMKFSFARAPIQRHDLGYTDQYTNQWIWLYYSKWLSFFPNCDSEGSQSVMHAEKCFILNFDLESKTNVECLTNFASPFRVPHSQCVFKIYPGTRITEIQKRKHSMRCNNNSSLSVFICLVTLCITETIMDIIFRKRVMADKWGSWPVMRRIESARSILWPNDVDRLTFADVK